MRPGAGTPEELENLFEDASIMKDAAALDGLIDEEAVMIAADAEEWRGRAAIARYVASAWDRGTYVAGSSRVVQARDIALVLSARSLTVARRGADGSWRFAITCPAWTKRERSIAVSERNKQIVRREVEELITGGDFSLIEEIIAEDYAAYDPSEPEPQRGREGFRESVRAFREAFEGFGVNIEDQIAEGDKVVTRWTFTGRHTGEVFGIAATGNRVAVSGISIERLVDGKIVEDHMAWDTLGLMRQIGAVPEMAS